MSSTFNEVRAAIESRIATEMALSPTYQVAYENTPFTPPNDATWLQASVRFGENNYATLIAPDTGLNAQNGTLVVNVFSSVGVGAGANLTVAERVKDLFDRKTVSGIIFDAASGPAVVAPSVVDAAYFQTQLTVTFTAYLE